MIYAGIRLTPEQIAATAAAEDVHCVGLSILSGGHGELVPEVLRWLRVIGVLPEPVRPRFVMRTLTIHATSLAGRPDNGDVVFLTSADDTRRGTGHGIGPRIADRHQFEGREARALQFGQPLQMAQPHAAAADQPKGKGGITHWAAPVRQHLAPRMPGADVIRRPLVRVGAMYSIAHQPRVPRRAEALLGMTILEWADG